MKHLIFYCLLLFGLLGFNFLSAQEFNSKNIGETISGLLPKQVNDTTPGLVIGIVHDGALIFSKGYGMANLTYGIPNDPKMVYNIGSVAKQFLGYAFAMLHEEGSIHLDDPVHKYLEDWPQFEEEVTLRHLLTHTSGYREAYTMSNLAGRIIGVDRLSREECLTVVRRQPKLEFTPGSRYTYNSTAWVILAEVFEKVKQQSAENWIKAHLLDPLGMDNTQIESYVGEVMVNAAESYSLNVDKEYLNEKSNRAIFGAADIFTSVEDLAKWVNNYKAASIGGEAIRDLFIDPFILNDGTNSEYALGIRNSTHNGLKLLAHTGGHEAFITQVSYYPEPDLGIIIISNFGGRGTISVNRIAEALLKESMKASDAPEKERIEMSITQLQQYEGDYLSSTMNRTLKLSLSDNQLTLNNRTKLIPIAQHIFQSEDGGGQYRFKALSDGQFQLTVAMSNSSNTYTSVEEWMPDNYSLAAFEGDYWSEELETVYHAVLKEGRLILNHRWLGDIGLEPLTQDVFQSTWGFYVKFNRGTKRTIEGFSIYSGRTLDVKFERKE